MTGVFSDVPRIEMRDGGDIVVMRGNLVAAGNAQWRGFNEAASPASIFWRQPRRLGGMPTALESKRRGGVISAMSVAAGCSSGGVVAQLSAAA